MVKVTVRISRRGVSSRFNGSVWLDSVLLRHARQRGRALMGRARLGVEWGQRVQSLRDGMRACRPWRVQCSR